jgi:hypothetical protein
VGEIERGGKRLRKLKRERGEKRLREREREREGREEAKRDREMKKELGKIKRMRKRETN